MKKYPAAKRRVRDLVFLAEFCSLSVLSSGLMAGRKDGDNEVHLTGFDRWKTEIAAVAVIGVWAVGTAVIVGMGMID